MPNYVLTDTRRDLWLDTFRLTAADLDVAGSGGWSITKRTLRGGKREGVDLIELDNGAFSVSVLPTRGMNLWRGTFRGLHLGWRSTVLDGPVNPAFVNLAAHNHLGWLDGFDELLARCGLEHNGPPFTEGGITYPLHGRISNIPAHKVSVELDDEPEPATLAVEGVVDESRLFFPQLRLRTRYETEVGSNRLTVTDTFVNIGEGPADVQMLYHWNLGPPFLGEGATFHAPIREVCPRNADAATQVDRYATYAGPTPNDVERVYLFDLIGADGPEGETLAMLKAPDGAKAVVLRFRRAELPCFTVWKNCRGLKQGYVTGLEPATNYPNPKPFEKERGRVVPLAPGQTHTAETTIEVLDSPQAIAAVEAEIRALQGSTTRIHPRPGEPFTTPA